MLRHGGQAVRYASELRADIKRFNGTLFRNRRALALDKDDIRELWIASQRDWRDVEPAIFGTLLERALDTRERARLGAHYTPRAYVERLVVPTVIEPLRTDWEEALAHAHGLEADGDRESALRTIKDFHHKLCTARVLDPACGTGNFLYVSLELMKRLEGEVLEALDDLGEDAPRFAMEGETVGPDQFYGLEINPRAVPIADLVLWIGYLKWQLRTVSADRIPEPVLHAYGTIRQQDAVLAYDKRELLRDERGRPLTRWDGFTTKPHPVTGEEVPNPDARVEQYRYENPRPAEWPEAEFVVGNPPFIGGKDMRAEFGDGYAEACWKARPKISGGADFVMHFWDEAAARLLRKPRKGRTNPLRRFGLLSRLVALNRERAEEERSGTVHWLSPDYQVPALQEKATALQEAEQIEADLAVPEFADGRPAWPRDELDRIRVVRDMLARAATPLAAENLNAAFQGRRSARREKGVEKVLRTLVAAGVAQPADGPDGGNRYFVPR